jgi:small subunit ribosomal protein S20
MALAKSQIKRVRQAEKRRLRNRSVKSEIKTTIAKLEEAIEQKKVGDAKELLKLTYKLLDKAVSKGVIHKNRAADKKSRWAQRVSILEKEKPTKATEEKKEEPKEKEGKKPTVKRRLSRKKVETKKVKPSKKVPKAKSKKTRKTKESAK